jgi:catechol 2,3-dioxygenase
MASPYHQKPIKYIESITLNVINQETMIRFYTNIIGLSLLKQTNTHTFLGTNHQTLLILDHRIAYPKSRKITQGLYHFALLVSQREDLASLFNHLLSRKINIDGLVDHGVSEALYFSDPEGNGIEVYWDKPKLLWPYKNGALEMGNFYINPEKLLVLSKPFARLSDQTKLGHLHLHVGDLDVSNNFFNETFGYSLTQKFGNQAYFLSDGGYHHHIGINLWAGSNLPKKNQDESGLRGYQVAETEIKNLIDVHGLLINETI